MERVIKFRAWYKNGKRFLKVHSIHFGTRKIIVSAGRYGNCSMSFDDVILEQFTGLIDKNGNEVYEGDKYEVFLEGINADDTAIRSVLIVEDMISFRLSLVDMWADIGTIIGNIHEGGI